MCSIVATALAAPSNSPRSPSFPVGSTQPEVLWRDDNFTAYREKANPVSSKGHIIIAFNLHVPSIYTLSSTDLPLLVNVRNLATRLLASFLPPSSPFSGPISSSSGTALDPGHALEPPTPGAHTYPSSAHGSSSPVGAYSPLQHERAQFHIGFITPPFKDTKIPVTDHLHAHAYIGPGDLMGWWRGVAYSSLAWYAIDDLIAEIRESVSNNRIKSGYTNRGKAPIDLVPSAGARSGTADGIDTTEAGLASADLDVEDQPDSAFVGGGSRSGFVGGGGGLLASPSSLPRSRSRTPTSTLAPQSQIPHLTV
ncbi:hypothetical protein HGRIS_007588 [Hohenbuehelia grisea]|uniref:Uncharacterized protein n=1 Tax=Hohenbuehelia grisea TaxID=104357 RepID=A0ABR3J5P3_9AGAR